MTVAPSRALSDNARAVLQHRYLRRAGSGFETPEQMFWRVARAIAAPESNYGANAADIEQLSQRFYQRMSSLEFLPNSPTLMNAGASGGQLAACFVVPVHDSTTDIFEAVRWAAEIHRTGGGTGFSFSRLRPMGDVVSSSGGQASGPIAFMHIFDAATEAIKQGGARRGANMGILRVDHPDIIDFISIKLDAARMRNFNLSVAITDTFMAALADDGNYPLMNPRTGRCVGELSARRVFDLITRAAWAVGDPGLVFIDRINRANPTPQLGLIEATNPCGEQPLLPFESCTLGSINLARFVDRGRGAIAWDALADAVSDAVHFLDNVIDANEYPLEQIASATRATRKIGLGVMGFADLLIELGIPYDDDAALEIAHAVASFIEERSIGCSALLGAARGAFPAWAESSWAGDDRPPMRNATTTTVAPTGTISIIAGCSSGIEPLYAICYERHVLDGQVLREVHPGFRDSAIAAGYWSAELAERLAERGRVRGLPLVPEHHQRLFATAHDVAPSVHLEIQAAFQKHVHAAVSKTINLPHEATVSEVAAAFRGAYERGCKGVTVFRDRSRAEQVLSVGDSSKAVLARVCPSCGEGTVGGVGCGLCRRCGWSSCR